MPTLDPRIDEYIAAAKPFAQPILKRVRKAFHTGCPDVVETIKWSRPFFEHGGPLGGMGAFKAHVAYGFWRAKEMDDPEQIFTVDGKAQMFNIRAEKAADLPTPRVLASYVRRAAALNGTPRPKKRKPAKSRAAPATPAVLKAALAKNKKAAEFFKSLPPSAKRDYVEWITSAKREATRDKRLATTIEWLSEGKRRNWKYESC